MAAAATAAAMRPLAAQPRMAAADRYGARSRRPLLLSPPTPALSVPVILSAAGDATALELPKEEIVSSLTRVEETIDVVTEAGSRVVEFSTDLLSALADALKPTVDAALPVIRGLSEEALRAASPALTDASEQAKEALQSAGVDPSPVLTAAKTVADAAGQTAKLVQGAKPIASAVVSTDPSTLLAAAGAAVVMYIVFPPIWSAISFGLRGYKGDLSAAQSLDAVVAQNYLLIDIRSEKEKSRSGVPTLPSNAKNRLISVPLEELPNKIKALVKNSRKVEAEIAALKISYLKRVGKGSNIIIMDSYSDTAKNIARKLTSLGFNNCFVMADGFSGRSGWSQSRLGTDAYSSSLVEVLSPSRIIPAATSRFSSQSQQLLPGSLDS